jgi:hypothetical protein
MERSQPKIVTSSKSKQSDSSFFSFVRTGNLTFRDGHLHNMLGTDYNYMDAFTLCEHEARHPPKGYFQRSELPPLYRVLEPGLIGQWHFISFHFRSSSFLCYCLFHSVSLSYLLHASFAFVFLLLGSSHSLRHCSDFGVRIWTVDLGCGQKKYHHKRLLGLGCC